MNPLGLGIFKKIKIVHDTIAAAGPCCSALPGASDPRRVFHGAAGSLATVPLAALIHDAGRGITAAQAIDHVNPAGERIQFTQRVNGIAGHHDAKPREPSGWINHPAGNGIAGSLATASIVTSRRRGGWLTLF